MNRQSLLIVMLIALLGASALWAHQRMASRQRLAEAAYENLQGSRHCAAQIESIRRRPAIAADSEAIGGEVQSAIEQSAATAGIEAARLSRITPESPQRLGDSVYKEKPTRVRLTDVTLEQLVTFLHTLGRRHVGLNARSIQLRAPRPADTGKLWIAEVVITHLLYDPPETGSNH